MKLDQEGLDILSGVEQAMGGQVSALKTKWYLLDFSWDKAGNWWLADNEADLFLQTPEGPHKIERLNPFDASIII